MNFVRMPLYKAIFDTRFGASQAFGAASARMGARTVGIEGDVTALWFHELGPHWSAGGAAPRERALFFESRCEGGSKP